MQYQQIFYKRTKQLLVKNPNTIFGRVLFSWTFPAGRTRPFAICKNNLSFTSPPCRTPLPVCQAGYRTTAVVTRAAQVVTFFSLIVLLTNQLSSAKYLMWLRPFSVKNIRIGLPVYTQPVWLSIRPCITWVSNPVPGELPSCMFFAPTPVHINCAGLCSIKQILDIQISK